MVHYQPVRVLAPYSSPLLIPPLTVIAARFTTCVIIDEFCRLSQVATTVMFFEGIQQPPRILWFVVDLFANAFSHSPKRMSAIYISHWNSFFRGTEARILATRRIQMSSGTHLSPFLNCPTHHHWSAHPSFSSPPDSLRIRRHP